MEFTKAEVLQVLSGTVLFREDPCSKKLIEWIGGEPANEAAYLDTTRINICVAYLIDVVPDLADWAMAIKRMHSKDVVAMVKARHDELHTLIDVPAYGPTSFPSPEML